MQVLQRRLLRDRQVVVIDKAPILRRRPRRAELEPRHRLETRTDGDANLRTDRRRIEIARIEGELVGHEVEQIAAGACEYPAPAKPNRTARLAEKEIAGGSRNARR